MPTECTETDRFAANQHPFDPTHGWYVRREPKSIEQLCAMARELAESLVVVARPRATPTLRSRVRDFQKCLLGVYDALAADVRSGIPTSSGAEWILDNFFVIDDQLREISDDLPPRYERQLPKLASGVSRVHELARQLVANTDCAIDEDSLNRFVSEFQSIAAFSIGELWAVPIMLRLALIENLCETCAQVMHTRGCESWATQVHGHWQTHRKLTLQTLPVDQVRALIPELIERFQEPGNTHAEGLAELARMIEEHGLTVPEIVHWEHQRRASNQITIANIVTSMRLVSSLNWIAFFERHSVVEAALRQDPAEIYPNLDLETRDRYRHVVEQLAKRGSHSDVEVATAAIELAKSTVASDEILPAHVGYWLESPGLEALERRVEYSPALLERFRNWITANPNATYLGSIGLLTFAGISLLLSATLGAGAPFWPTLAVTFLAAIPLSELAVQLTNLLVTSLVKPRLLPKLDLSKGIPAQFKTVVVIPCLLSNSRDIDQLLSNLEIHFLSNPEPAIRFALLSDFSDHSQAAKEDDDALLDHAQSGVRRLNVRYGGDDGSPFLLLHRPRRWNEVEQVWMGWERKRGKLMEFNQWLLGTLASPFSASEGNVSWFWNPDRTPAVRFIITLDADTHLPTGAAAKLIGTLGHPLNSPRGASNGQRPRSGYVVLQPRVGIRLSDAHRTRYSRLFANSPGVDPYITSASDVYQDLFGEGSYTGKGIYDLRTFEGLLSGVFPENQILSHDLIEGNHVRAALVSDIELTDGFPPQYAADARRQHRWVRGDWQLLPWLAPMVPTAKGSRRNPLSPLARWKIVDNLRRSLVPVMLLAMLLGSWLLLPQQSWGCSILGALVLAFPLLSQMTRVFRNIPHAIDWAFQVRSIGSELAREVAQVIFQMSLLPHRAFLMADAIGRTLWRQLVSRRNMLEWETAAATERRLQNSGSRSQQSLLWSTLFAGAVLVISPLASWAGAIPWLLAWSVAPLLVYWVNQPIRRRSNELTVDDKQFLRGLARRTWAFFETFVGSADNWLPPDNAQEIPAPKIAHRISPTNQGLFMVSGLVAHDFGFIGLTSLVELWEKNLASWEKLDRFNGHFLNWYDTTTLQPLFPRYVSTVDSGNLDACCLLMRQGIEDLRNADVLGERAWRGLRDSIAMVRESLDILHPKIRGDAVPGLEPLREALAELERRLERAPENESAWLGMLWDAAESCAAIEMSIAGPDWMARESLQVLTINVRHLVNHFESIRVDARSLLGWFEVLSTNALSATRPQGMQPVSWPTDDTRMHDLWSRLWGILQNRRSIIRIAQLEDDLCEVFAELRAAVETMGEDARRESLEWLDRLQTAIGESSSAAWQLDSRLANLSDRLEAISDEIDYQFLFNPQRRLFSIGYNLEDRQLDRSHYDMLCSEARLASFLAIGKGDADTRHWFQLGRQLTSANGNPLLLSWGGTMFEYLMPNLFQRLYDGSVLDASCRGAVARQREYGRQQGIPWGISESAYAALAQNAEYQYRSFGVPGLGLKRGLGKDLVVSPYSTFLALEIEPAWATANLRAMAADALGPWGFYDAVDYSPSRLPMGTRSIVVRCVMSHHQSMSLLAVGNALSNGVLRRRFHAHPFVRATELLLQERVPRYAQPIMPHPDDLVVSPTRIADTEFVSRRFTGVSTAAPRTQLLSNGRWTTMLTSNGGGFCRFGDVAVTRWRADATRDHWGLFFYLRDVHSGKVWSPAFQPTCVSPDAYEVLFSIDKAEFFRRDDDIEVRMEVTVSPENHADVRSIKITNDSAEPREIELTSYAEISLATLGADLAHPAFEKLFLQTEFLGAPPAILVSRRPREAGHVTPWVMHVIALENVQSHDLQFETSRQVFLGRGRTTRFPAALESLARWSGHVGAVLDPVAALRCTLKLAPNETISVGFATAYAESRNEAESLANQYQDPRNIQRAFDLAWAYNQIQLRHLHLTPTQAHLYQRIASALLFSDPHHRGRPELMIANRQGQAGLWRHGISGDHPLLLLHLTQPEQLYLVRDLLSAQQYWGAHGLATDVVLLNDHPGSYFDLLHEQLMTLLSEFPRLVDEKSTGVFVLRSSQISEDDRALLEAAASVVVHGARGSLSRQFRSRSDVRESEPGLASPRTPPETRRESEMSPERRRSRPRRLGYPQPVRIVPEVDAGRRMQLISELEYWNGHGGFAAEGREYRILLSHGSTTPMPWSNVIANPQFGCMVTESGGGNTWFGNSRENRLTTWNNDPISDTPAEALYIRDDDLWNVWSPYPGVFRDSGDYWIHHGQGYSEFRHAVAGIEHTVHISVAQQDSIKFVRVLLRNRLARARRLSLTYFAEWVLGDIRERTGRHVVTAKDETSGALMATNGYHQEFASQVAFLQVLEPERTLTGDRTEFLGRNGSPFLPLALQYEGLSGQLGPGRDSCGAIQTQIVIEPMGEREVIFMIGAGGNLEGAQSLLRKYARPDSVRAEVARSLAAWDEVLGVVQVDTPDLALNFLANRWLLYQVISCRLWGRSAFYQSGGAYGFRDQLQDVLAVLHCKPEWAREHLLRAASRQFEEGDVQHWWHPPSGRGTRTRFSDDLLWLPFVVSKYLDATDDIDVLNQPIAYLRSNPLESHEQERYETPEVSSTQGSLFDHCLRAINHALRFGEHGLPLMGSGDWNDGMNRVGDQGKGESIWVGFFLMVILRRFIALTKSRGEHEIAANYQRIREQLAAALESHGWDGQWYRRAYTDEGTPLGSEQNAECQIDSIAQSWAAFADANPERVRRALQSAAERLILTDKKLVLLLTPPFDKSEIDPGYIQGYLPGIRENGGQYTHAAIWLMQAFGQRNDLEQAMAMFQMMHPIGHALSPSAIQTYQVEPYVVAADIYGVAPHEGRGGWTWYTGSAAWMYQAIIGSLLGVRIERSRVVITPRLPANWPRFSFSIRRGKTSWRFTVVGGSAETPASPMIEPQSFELIEDNQPHEILIYSPASTRLADVNPVPSPRGSREEG